ncbi:MAG: hypothetical protein E7222_12885 [Clostridiales bacterium]|nr:hypothetical protein [Clostridiales bacterium]
MGRQMADLRKEFRLIKAAQKLCRDLVEVEGHADKRYRFSICQDIRHKSERVMHLIRKANVLPAGNEQRIQMQQEADELLEEIKDLLWVMGKLLTIGVKYEAQIELSIENLQIPLRNWMETDQKKSVAQNEQRFEKASQKLEKAKAAYEMVSNYYEENKTERVNAALIESKARFRLAREEYVKAKEKYDAVLKQLRNTQDRYHKDDSVLYEVLKEISKKTGIENPLEI